MLIKLTSNTSGDMIMFAEHAHQLFEIIGKECTASGVFTAEQLPDAIARLHQAVEEEKLAAKHHVEEEHTAEADDAETDDADEKPEKAVPLGRRAVPLLHLMEWTLKEKGFILWEAAKDF